MRYFFQIAYKGTAYRGWQRQINVPTVQEVMEQVLSQLLKRPITCIGCGRTDAGVHASQYFFHIDYEASLPENLLFLLQKNLPGDIVVYQIFLMEGWPHAQFDAVERTYRYYLHTQVNPFWQDLSAFYPIDLSVPLLQKALDLLPQYQDYRAFCKTPDRHASTLCQVNFAHLASDVEQTYFCIELRANRFLKSMVRLLVGQLLE
ncbi:MAG: tRNA pseudouridine synthase A, partial [Bacteroidota bacterium]